jgi:hypothetical protein
VLYERAIGSRHPRPGRQIIYTANLNGGLLESDGILKGTTHAAPLRSDPRKLRTLPEIGSAWLEHFGEPADKLRWSAPSGRRPTPAEELFETFVPPEDFLACWGQQFKRIGGEVVANPGLPAVLRRYTPQANVFVVVVRSADGSPGFFAALNRAIYLEITSRAETPLVDGERLGGVPWSERVRRTYHLSRTHLMAMFDMADLVYLGEGRRFPLADTPLGRRLRADGILSDQQLLGLPSEPLRRVQGGSHRTLHYLPLAGEGQDLDWARDFLRKL